MVSRPLLFKDTSYILKETKSLILGNHFAHSIHFSSKKYSISSIIGINGAGKSIYLKNKCKESYATNSLFKSGQKPIWTLKGIYWYYREPFKLEYPYKWHSWMVLKKRNTFLWAGILNNVQGFSTGESKFLYLQSMVFLPYKIGYYDEAASFLDAIKINKLKSIWCQVSNNGQSLAYTHQIRMGIPRETILYLLKTNH